MTEPSTYRYDVFISYSHADKDWVQGQLLPRLESAGLRVCIDYRDFEIGLPSLTNMERAADDSRHTLAVMTPKYVESEWCEFETLLVGTGDPAGRRRKLIPLMLDACSLPTRIAMLTYADFTRPAERANEYDRLLKQLLDLIAQPAAPMTNFSPFIVGPPILHPRQFFGHDEVLYRLFDMLSHYPLQNAIVIGPRRSGKTSLLLTLRNLITIALTTPEQLRPDQRVRWLPQPDRYRWVYVNFQDSRLGSREALLRYILASLNLPVPIPCDLDGFMDVASRRLRAPTVILLDEIEAALHRCPEMDNSFWECLRALATTEVEGSLSFVLAASEEPSQVARQNGIGSPFFNIFGYTATLGPLAELEARKLIDNSPLPFPPTDVEWILSESRNWAILLQVLCRERLLSLQRGRTDDTWRVEGSRQMEPFRHLLIVP